MPTSSSSRLSPKREFWLLLTLAGIQFTHILDFMIMMPLGRNSHKFSQSPMRSLVCWCPSIPWLLGASGLLAATYPDKFDRKKLLLSLYILFGLATLARGMAPLRALPLFSWSAS